MFGPFLKLHWKGKKKIYYECGLCYWKFLDSWKETMKVKR
jgi:hypothetical protein